MGLYDIGTICVKIAGRDANKRCVIVELIDANTVLIDGETRRRKCNVRHLEPLSQKVDLKKGASTKEVATALKGLGITVIETKPKKSTQRPKVVRKKKVYVEKNAKKSAKTKESKPSQDSKPSLEESAEQKAIPNQEATPKSYQTVEHKSEKVVDKK